MEGIDVTYIHKCLHDPEDAPLCPIFKLGDIVKQSGFNFETIARVVSQLHYIFTQHWMDRKVFFRWTGRFPFRRSTAAHGLSFGVLFLLYCLVITLYHACIVCLCPDREGPLVLWSTGRVT